MNLVSAITISSVTRYDAQGRRPGIVVMGGDSTSEGRGFESRCRILDGYFFTLICCKNCFDAGFEPWSCGV